VRNNSPIVAYTGRRGRFFVDLIWPEGAVLEVNCRGGQTVACASGLCEAASLALRVGVGIIADLGQNYKNFFGHLCALTDF
jgi:hypothetical protein